ncbi:hypothetical protein Trydic_g6012 [Trypoxylus dichotomus]
MSETAFRFTPCETQWMDGYSPSPFYDWPSPPDTLKATLRYVRPSRCPQDDFRGARGMTSTEAKRSPPPGPRENHPAGTAEVANITLCGAHDTKDVDSLLGELFLKKWIGRYSEHVWPLRSPNLTSCDFSLWEYPKNEVCKHRAVRNIDQLQGTTGEFAK